MALKGPKSILFIDMLHIKSKVMKSTIQLCKQFAPGACLGVTRSTRAVVGQRSSPAGYILYCNIFIIKKFKMK